MSTSGYAVSTQVPRIRSMNKVGRKRPRELTKARPMKLTFKQKLRNWLMNDESDYDNMAIAVDEGPSIDSNGIRMQVYKASGGVVIETRSYDRHKDENRNSLYVITEDKDLGEEIGKIITMENLR